MAGLAERVSDLTNHIWPLTQHSYSTVHVPNFTQSGPLGITLTDGEGVGPADREHIETRNACARALCIVASNAELGPHTVPMFPFVCAKNTTTGTIFSAIRTLSLPCVNYRLQAARAVKIIANQRATE